MSAPNSPPVEGQDYTTTPVYRLKGKVVHGFGRGSKLLGYPTANLDPAAFKDSLGDLERGVYLGWAKIDPPKDGKTTDNVDSGVYKAMLSLGTNPQFNTTEETVEAYIYHDFGQDFYDYEMSLIICAYRRPQLKFNSLDELIHAIKSDVDVGVEVLELEDFNKLKNDNLFTKSM